MNSYLCKIEWKKCGTNQREHDRKKELQLQKNCLLLSQQPLKSWLQWILRSVSTSRQRYIRIYTHLSTNVCSKLYLQKKLFFHLFNSIPDKYHIRIKAIAFIFAKSTHQPTTEYVNRIQRDGNVDLAKQQLLFAFLEKLMKKAASLFNVSERVWHCGIRFKNIHSSIPPRPGIQNFLLLFYGFYETMLVVALETNFQYIKCWNFFMHQHRILEMSKIKF